MGAGLISEVIDLRNILLSQTSQTQKSLVKKICTLLLEMFIHTKVSERGCLCSVENAIMGDLFLGWRM